MKLKEVIYCNRGKNTLTGLQVDGLLIQYIFVKFIVFHYVFVMKKKTNNEWQKTTFKRVLQAKSYGNIPLLLKSNTILPRQASM